MDKVCRRVISSLVMVMNKVTDNWCGGGTDRQIAVGGGRQRHTQRHGKETGRKQ